MRCTAFARRSSRCREETPSRRVLPSSPWTIPDQYIDITNVPDGRYLLVYRVNVGGQIQEANSGNNTASACIELHEVEVTGC